MKNILKAFLPFALLFVLLFGCGAGCIFATEAITATCTFNAGTDSYSVSGMLDSSMGNQPVILSLFTETGEFYTGFETIAERTENGDVVYSFEAFRFPLNAPSGVYTLKVTAEFLGAEKTIPLFILSSGSKLEFLRDVINPAITEHGDVLTHVKEKAQYLSLDTEVLAGISSREAAASFNSYYASSYTLPDNLETSEKQALLDNAWNSFCVDTEKAILIATFIDINSSTELQSWLGTYTETLKLAIDSEETPQDETAIYDYLQTIQGSEAFFKRIESVSEISDVDQVRDIIYEATLLSAIESQHYGVTYNIFTDFPQLFAVDGSLMSRLTNDQLGEIYKTIANKPYVSYQSAIDAFEEAAEQLLKSKTENNGSNSTSGGGGTGTYYSEKVTGKTETAQGLNQSFNDLHEAEWAREAILAMTERGILNGRGDRSFAPNDYVTRAEFVKMIVLITGRTFTGAESGFTDVPKDAWYAEYVAIAKDAGYIEGNDDNTFMPTAQISRQDMAVIIYRAFSLNSSLNVPEFTDFDAVAKYAQEAVSSLYAEGIINGVGDGSFSPAAFATRAQAAKMLYKFL